MLIFNHLNRENYSQLSLLDSYGGQLEQKQSIFHFIVKSYVSTILENFRFRELCRKNKMDGKKKG